MFWAWLEKLLSHVISIDMIKVDPNKKYGGIVIIVINPNPRCANFG